MNFCKGNTQKRILKILRDLPLEPDGSQGEKTNQELSEELDIDIEKIIEESHKLETKNMLRLTKTMAEDSVVQNQLRTYDILPDGIKSLEVNWKQRILNSIFIIGFIIAVILAVKEFL